MDFELHNFFYQIFGFFKLTSNWCALNENKAQNGEETQKLDLHCYPYEFSLK
jgi:hypothetical protein